MNPYLVNAAGKWTRHKFVRAEFTVLGELTEHQVSGNALIYECTETGAERRYGFEGRVAS